jgi:RNA polymerase sigma factor (TIGR02999 family)
MKGLAIADWREHACADNIRGQFTAGSFMCTGHAADADDASTTHDGNSNPGSSNRIDSNQGAFNSSDAGERTEALFSSLYRDLRRLARREVRRNGGSEILGTGTLVHEAWINISKQPALDFDEPGRFLAYAARTMRGLVVDRVRARHAKKRGGDFVITSIDTLNAEQIMQPESLESVADALQELEAVDPDLAHVVDLKFFCGFTLAEVACMQDVSERTIQRQWEKARLLLLRALST